MDCTPTMAATPEDVVRVRAARHIRGGPVQAEQDLAVGVGARHVLHEFAGDVAGIQIGKNQDVGPPATLLSGNLPRQFPE